MHVLLVNNIYPPIMAGGAELIVSYLAENLAKQGHRVTVVSTCGPEMEPYPIEHRNGVEVIRFFPKNLYWHWQRQGIPAWKKTLWHLRDAWNLDAKKRFNQLLETYKPDLMHTHVIDGFSASIWQAAKQKNIPVIHTAHDYHLLCPRAMLLTKSGYIYNNPPTLAYRIYRAWHMATTRYVDLFCSPSQFLLEKHSEHALRAGKQAAVRNGIPLPESREKKRNAPVRFLFASRLTEEKGCGVLIDAMADNMDCELWVAGKGPYEEEFRKRASNDPRIRFLGYIQGEEKERVFRDVDFLLIPSLWFENAPVAIVEAAAYGLGVIGSDLGAIPEFIEHEKTGLLFEAGNSRSLAAAMRRAAEAWKPEVNHALLAESSVDAMADSYLAHYETLRRAA